MNGLLKAASLLEDRLGRGGKTRLARALGWDYSTLWRKLNGRTRVSPADLLAAEAAVRRHRDRKSNG